MANELGQNGLGSRRLSKPFRYVTIAVLCCLGIALSVGAFGFTRDGEHRRQSDRFDATARDRVTAIREQIEEHFLILESLRALYAANADQEISRRGFRTFCTPLLARHQDIQALEWIPRVPSGKRGDYEAAARADGLEAFQIAERTSQGYLIPAAQREEYFPVCFVEPLKGNEKAIGFDLASEPMRLEALSRSRDTGEMVATAPITLVQETEHQAGFLVFVPVYDANATVETVQQRRDHLKGFILGVFRAGDLVKDALANIVPVGIDMELCDSTESPRTYSLYYHVSHASTRLAKEPRYASTARADLLTYRKTFSLAGRKWSVVYAATPTFLDAHTTIYPWGVLGAGLIFTLLASAYLASATRYAARQHQLVRQLSGSNQALCKEVSERKEAQEALQEATQFNQEIIASAREGIIVYGPDLKYRVWNPFMERLTGLSASEVLGRHPLEVFPFLRGAGVIERLETALAGQTPDATDYPYRVQQTGRTGWASDTSAPVRNVRGEVVGVIATVCDITERKRSEEALREREEDLSITLHSIGDAVIATDIDGRVVRMNPVAERLIGWPLAEAAGKPLAEVFRIVNARTREPVADPLKKALASGEVVTLTNDTVLIARDGAERQIADSAAPIRDGQGRIRGVVLVFHDVTGEYEIKKALRRLAVIAEQAVEGIAVADLDGNLQFVNDAWARMHGYESGAQLVGNPLRIFHTDEQFKTDVAPFLATVKRQGHHKDEVGHMRRDGTTFPTQMTVVILKDEQGQPCGTAAFADDITERRRAEEERRRLTAILEATPDFVGFADAKDARILYMNKAARRMTGLTPDEDITRLKISDVHPEWANRMLLETVLPAAGRDGVWTGECAFVHRDGHEIPVLMSLLAHKTSSGEVEAFSTISRDITERKRAEEDLRQTNEHLMQLNARLNTTAEELKALMRRVVEDAAFTGRFNNPLLLPCWEAKKCNQLTCPAHGRSDDLRCWETAGTFCKGKVQGQFALKLKDCSKCEVYQAARADPICDLGETFNNMMAIIQQRNLDIEAMNRKLEHASAAKSRFLANMSHEIRTPMTAILGFAELLSDSLECCVVCPECKVCPTRRQNQEYIQTVRRNGEHLLGLINDILDLSKIEADQMRMERLECSPVLAVEEVLSLMRVRAIEKGLSLEAEYEFPLSGLIWSDPIRLRQILVNLVGNAIKFTAQGQVNVLVRSRPGQADGQALLELEVRDTGIGLSEEQIGRLFQPFVQADASTTRQYGGSGLGLAICKHLAKALGGDISVTSRPGEGSSFFLQLPASMVPSGRWLRYLADLSHDDKDSPGPSNLQGVALHGRILLAEDGLDNQKLISTILRQAGAAVDVASNGSLALEAVVRASSQQRPYDVILMDMQMPEMDGYQAAERIRGLSIKTPIVALTAHAMAADRQKCLDAGCTDYMAKPVNRIALLNMVAQFMDGATVATEATVPSASVQKDEGPIYCTFQDDKQMADLIAEFVSALPGRMNEMRQALANGDWDSLRRLAHQMKGAGGGYGYGQLTEASAALEAQAKAQDREGAALALGRLSALCGRVEEGASKRGLERGENA